MRIWHRIWRRYGGEYEASYVPCPNCGSGKWRVIRLFPGLVTPGLSAEMIQKYRRANVATYLGLICINCGNGFEIQYRWWGFKWFRKRWPERVWKG
ncbi:hypothetical protein LCGC14_2439570 [marine sediment metagenome]|uniref:Uncharacterized protein n=1 Tax=marine sediment metagenome TaxID=412755 RepID=A0A0F9BJJ0_9ZZZZ